MFMLEICVIVNNRLLMDVLCDLDLLYLFILLMLFIMKILFDVKLFLLFGIKDVFKLVWKNV